MSTPMEATKSLVAGMEQHYMTRGPLPDKGKLAAYVSGLSDDQLIELYADLKFVISIASYVCDRATSNPS